MKCIIIEDEPIAAEILAEYVAQTPFLELTHICHNALAALEVVRSEPVDVLFLDINLPKLNGLEFLKSLRRPPKVIITSAHHEYAIQGFDLQVVDYLLKPVEFSRFTKAAQKLLSPVRPSEPGALFKPTRPFYFFTVSKRSVKIYLDEILYIESLKESVTIRTIDKSYATSYQLGELEEMLRNDDFLRIHRSFMVSVNKIRAYSTTEVEVGNRILPIGRSHKEYVMMRLGVQ
jgi:DNA-binding LytR/AlgR family response regulator